MAKLKAKKSEVVETVETPVENDENENGEYMTSDEAEVISADGENYQEEKSEVSSERMQSVLDLLQEEYDIKNKGFELTGYADKGSKIVATVSNRDYDVQFTLKSSVLLRLTK